MILRLKHCALRGVVSATAIVFATMTTVAHAEESPATPDAPPVGSTNPTGSMEDIIVTASRRSATIRETPISIAAYGGDQLAKEHIQKLDDLVTRSPNIQFGFNGTNTNIAIRGIGNNLQGAANDPGVAYHSDGAYVSDTGLALATFLDVNRVEILRGPQGTLFGRNATGGAVNVISNAPTTDAAFGFNISAGVPLGEHIDGFASGPLNSDKTLLARASFEQTYQRGDVKNVDPTGPRRLNDKDDYAARLQLEWRPTDRFSARLMGTYQKSMTAGSPYYYVGQVNNAPPPELSGTFIAKPGADKIGVTEGDVYLKEEAAALFLDWSIGFGAFRGMVSQRHTVNDRHYDGDGTPVVYLDYTGNVTRDTTNAELLFSSDNAKPFSVIIGANYYNDDANSLSSTYVPFVLPFPIQTVAPINTKSYAAFGHAEYKLAPGWKVFGGARYSSDHKELTEKSNLVPTSLTQQKSWSRMTFEFGTSYDFNSAATGYIKYATGYKGGGFSAGSYAPPFNPETNKMWEAGLKGSFFGKSLEVNLAAFHMSYQDLQVFQITGLITRVTNAAAATVNGAEIELVQHVTPELRLEFGGGWLDAKFDKFITSDSARPLGDGVTLNDAGRPAFNLAGNRLPSAAKFTAGGGPVYSHEFSNGSKLTLAARYDWKSRVYFTEFNLPLVSQKPSGRLSAYANYDLPGGRWQFGVYGRNLTNETTFGSLLVYSVVLHSMTAGTLYPKREFGLQAHYRF